MNGEISGWEFSGDTFSIPSSHLKWSYGYSYDSLVASTFGKSWFLLLSPKAYEDGLSILINRHDSLLDNRGLNLVAPEPALGL
ncbi:MAG: hypothetical protein ABIM74_01330 [candidate division WOR-3 bacterium]